MLAGAVDCNWQGMVGARVKEWGGSDRRVDKKGTNIRAEGELHDDKSQRPSTAHDAV